ncbi:GNAT family N-acetyltransferase [Virgibacillus sp. DJP39]|uniref:GNAT family N-acetyltransferase n=1 Tax=Virgibacillus sp. DJP39 TaxID=3409790 RepID=UPI003BB7519C
MILNLTTKLSSAYKVRKADKNDVSAVINMLTGATEWLKEKGIDQWSYLHSGKENHEIEAAIVRGTTYVVEDIEERLIASFNLSPEKNNWDLQLWGNGTGNDNAVYLHRLVVAPDQHKKDIGKELMYWMIKNKDQKSGPLRLDCIGHNEVLNRFYQEAGFTYIGSHNMDGQWFSKYQVLDNRT